MMKRFFLIVFCILISNNAVFSQIADKVVAPDSSVEIQTIKLLEKVKYHRNTIYDSLELTAEQVSQIQKLDNNLYQGVEPELKKLTQLTKNMQDVALSDNCTKKAINNIKKEFKSVEKDMNSIKQDYDKQFEAVLTSKQKSKYKLARKQKRAEFKKEMEKQRKLQKEKA